MSFSYDRPQYRKLPTVNHETIFQWTRDVNSLYRNLATDIYKHGLRDLICTDAEWQALPGNQANTARPVRDLPNNPAGNASAADLTLHNRLVQNRSRALGLANDAKEFLIQSIGASNVMKLRDPITDMENVTELQIVTAMKLKYSKLTSTTLDTWSAFLLVPIDGSADIEHFLASHKDIHDNFKCVGQPLSESEAINRATKALLSRPAAGLAVSQYKFANLNVALQTFDAFSDYLVEKIPNMFVTVSPMSFAA